MPDRRDDEAVIAEESVDWGDVRAGDEITLLVMDPNEGIVREPRSVVAVSWPKVTLRDGERHYEVDATKDSLQRRLRRLHIEPSA